MGARPSGPDRATPAWGTARGGGADADRGAGAPAGSPPGAPARYGEGLPPNLAYPWNTPRQSPGAPAPPLPPTAPPRTRRRPRLGRWLLLAIALVLVATIARFAIFVAAVSTAPLYSVHYDPLARSGRANLLILGYGGANHDGGYLTDSLLLLSADMASGKSAQISVPRDLWVQIPPDSGQYAKINAAYAYGMQSGRGSAAAGGDLATLKVSQVTGMPVDRWVSIDFQRFRALVDALGGVDITVDRAFTSQYPANDNPAIDPGWITVSFQAGRQHMNGETAIRYARARYATDPAEASDFARSQRQQKLTRSIVAKALRPTSWWRVFAVLNAVQPALRTNLSALDMLVLAARGNLTGSTPIALNDTNVLEDASSADGQAILRPRGGDYGVIARYIAERLAGGGP